MKAHLIAADSTVSEVLHVAIPPPMYLYSSSAVHGKAERYRFIAVDDGIAYYEHAPLGRLPGR